MSAEVVTPLKIHGLVHEWKLSPDHTPRRYLVHTMPFGVARDYIKTYAYTATTNQGEQREQDLRHVAKLRNAMLNGDYTPQCFNCAVNPKTHEVHFSGKSASFEVDPNNPLRLVDGGHRKHSLEDIFASDNAELQDLVADVPVTMLVYLDGDPKVDFIHLQEGKAVDRAQLQSMRIRGNMFSEDDNPIFKFAFQVARKLHQRSSGSHLESLIRFDTTKAGPNLVPINSILQRGTSEFSHSLYGGAKIATHYKRDVDWLAGMYIEAYLTLKADGGDLLESDRVLAGIKEGGGRAGCNLMLGMGNMLAYRCVVQEHTTEEQIQKDTAVLVKAAKSAMDHHKSKGSAATDKRRLMGDFAEVFFGDLTAGSNPTLAAHEGVPVALMELLSYSAFDRKRPADANDNGEQPRRRGRPRKNG